MTLQHLVHWILCTLQVLSKVRCSPTHMFGLDRLLHSTVWASKQNFNLRARQPKHLLFPDCKFTQIHPCFFHLLQFHVSFRTANIIGLLPYCSNRKLRYEVPAGGENVSTNYKSTEIEQIFVLHSSIFFSFNKSGMRCPSLLENLNNVF